MKPLIFFFCMAMLLASALNAREIQMTKTKALELMEKHLEKKAYELIGIRMLYPCGYGLPGYVGYFKVNSSDSNKSIFSIGVDASGNVEGLDKGYPASYFDVIVKFMDSAFAKNEIEAKVGQPVAALYLIKCSLDHCYINCFGMPLIFWRAFLEDGEELFFYYGIDKWIILGASDQRRAFFKDQKEAIKIK